MKKEGVLFDLIKSLTKSEKRSFNIFATRYAIKDRDNYIKLFTTIDKQQKYDEAKLIKKIYGSSFSGSFGGMKNYLYYLILDCLDSHHKDSSIDRKASKYINISRILSEKRLDDQSDKIIERGRKLSIESNRFENTIALNSLKEIAEFKRETITPKKIQAYYEENLSAIESMKLKLNYRRLYHELLYKRLQMGSITSPVEKEELKTFRKNLYFSSPPPNDSFDSNMYYLLAHIEHSRILMDTDNRDTYVRKLITLFEHNTNRVQDNVDYHIYSLNIFNPKNRSEADSALKKIGAIPSLISEKNISYDVRLQVFQVYYTLLTHIALIFRDYESAIPHIEKFKTESKIFDKDFTPSFRLCLESNIACIYFGTRQYKEALKWCNAAMAHPLKIRPDLVYNVRILFLLVHYELGNQIILPSLIRSVYSSLKKMNKENQFSTILLKHLSLLVNAESNKEEKIIFIRLKENLIPLHDNKFENAILNDIDVIAWIDRNIENPS